MLDDVGFDPRLLCTLRHVCISWYKNFLDLSLCRLLHFSSLKIYDIVYMAVLCQTDQIMDLYI